MSSETTTKKSRSTKAATKVTTGAVDIPDIEAFTQPEEATEKYVPKKVDPDQIVQVYNGFHGPLVYKSRKTGEKFKWQEFGDYQDMELSELKSARSASKKFFINNWFMFDEDWIIDYLGMSRYYKNAIRIEDFDKFFEKPIEEISDAVSSMSKGQKKSLTYRARQLIADGVIDSNKKILALEQCLGVDLVER